MAQSSPVTYFLVSAIIYFRFSSAAEDGIIRFRMPENSPNGSFIGNILENMLSLDNVSSEIRENARFTFLNPNAADNLFFSLDLTSGVLTASEVNIDRETVCPYKIDCKLEVSVAVKSVDGFFEVAAIIIEILDLNDNKPTFPTSAKTFNISESMTAGAEYLLDAAEDPDMFGNNSVQSYDLIQDYDIFDLVVSSDGTDSYQLKLILKQQLDREIMGFYFVKVIARDGGEPALQGILNIDVNVIDANDNSPVFEKDYYNITVKESIAPGTVILVMSASDADFGKNREISYRFRERQSDIDVVKRLFEVSETSGELSVLHDLHSEQSESFEFIVEAVDHGNQPRMNKTTVLVRIQDAANNAPVITLHLLASDKIGFVNLSESEKIGAFVAHINVEDTDIGENGNVTCQSENDYFGIEKLLVRGYKIVTVKSLDREIIPLHDVIVTCFDNGSPSLSSSVSFLVSVDDANDNTPKFDKPVYRASMYENNDLGDKIAKVTATDLDIGINKLFEYVLHPFDNSIGNFTINNNSGDIYAVNSFDREVTPLFVFRVIAVDQGTPRNTGTATISLTILDQNDNIPHILPARPKLQVMENMPVNTSLGYLNGFDDDEGINSKLTFTIAPVYATFPFELSVDGEFTTTEKLNRELQSRYEIPVTVSDMGTNPLSNTQYVSITVMDENDNAPVVTFPNDANDSVDFIYPLVGKYNVVTSIAAYDVDEGENSSLTYSFTDGNELGIFEIDSNIGEISVSKFIDIEKDISITLSIKVQDRGVPPLETTVSMTINLIYANATKAPSTEPSSNKYIVISVVVVIATILIAVAIVGVILFLRSMDRNKGADGEEGSAGYSDSGISSHSESQTLPHEMDNGGDGKKKKKEVSFSLEFSLDGLDGGRNAESSTDSGLPENRYYDAPPSYHSLHNIKQEKIDSHMKAIKLQQYLWEAKSREWENANMQVQQLPLGDSESETSRETITCDSGRGGSEDDVSTTSPTAEDRKSFGFTDTKSSGKHVTFKTYQNTNPHHLHYAAQSVKQSSPVHDGIAAIKQPLMYRKMNSNSDVPRRNSTPNDTKLMIKNFQQFKNQNASNIVQTVPIGRSEPWRDYFKQHTCQNEQFMNRHDSFNSVRSNDDDGGSTTTSGSYTLDPEEVDIDLFSSRPSQMVV